MTTPPKKLYADGVETYIKSVVVDRVVLSEHHSKSHSGGYATGNEFAGGT